MTIVRAIGLVVLGAVVVACGTGPERSPQPSPSTVALALRTMAVTGSCAGVGLDAELHGDPKDPSIAWLTSLLPAGDQPDPGADRLEVVWPTGYTAVFDPTLRVIEPTGQTAMQEGDHVDGGCVTGGPLLLLGPMDGFRLECGTVPRSTCTSVLNGVHASQSAQWPKVRLAAFIVRDASGHYTVVFEDGQRFDGYASPNL